jgi:hypothetical protein
MTEARLAWVDNIYIYVFKELHLERIQVHIGSIYLPKIINPKIPDELKPSSEPLIIPETKY